jgi:hypothetical protein
MLRQLKSEVILQGWLGGQNLAGGQKTAILPLTNVRSVRLNSTFHIGVRYFVIAGRLNLTGNYKITDTGVCPLVGQEKLY